MGRGAWPLSVDTPVTGRKALDPLAWHLYSCIFGVRLYWEERLFCLFSLGTGCEGGQRRRPKPDLQPEGCRADQIGH